MQSEAVVQEVSAEIAKVLARALQAVGLTKRPQSAKNKKEVLCHLSPAVAVLHKLFVAEREDLLAPADQGYLVVRLEAEWYRLLILDAKEIKEDLAAWAVYVGMVRDKIKTGEPVQRKERRTIVEFLSGLIEAIEEPDHIAQDVAFRLPEWTEEANLQRPKAELVGTMLVLITAEKPCTRLFYLVCPEKGSPFPLYAGYELNGEPKVQTEEVGKFLQGMLEVSGIKSVGLEGRYIRVSICGGYDWEGVESDMETFFMEFFPVADVRFLAEFSLENDEE